MPWACPQFVFGSDAWYEPLMFVWGDRDYMFASSARGASLSEASSLVDRPATPYMIVKYLSEIAVQVSSLDLCGSMCRLFLFGCLCASSLDLCVSMLARLLR